MQPEDMQNVTTAFGVRTTIECVFQRTEPKCEILFPELLFGLIDLTC